MYGRRSSKALAMWLTIIVVQPAAQAGRKCTAMDDGCNGFGQPCGVTNENGRSEDSNALGEAVYSAHPYERITARVYRTIRHFQSLQKTQLLVFRSFR